MGIAPGVSGFEANQIKEFTNPFVALGPTHVGVDDELFRNRSPDSHSRIEGGDRILKDDLEIRSEFSQLNFRHAQNVNLLSPVGPVDEFPEDDLTGRGFEQPQDATGRSRLAAAGLADKAQCRASTDIERDVGDRRHDLPAGSREHASTKGELLDQVSDRNRRAAVTQMGTLQGVRHAQYYIRFEYSGAEDPLA